MAMNGVTMMMEALKLMAKKILIILQEVMIMLIMIICDFALCVQFKPKARGWMHRIFSPGPQLFSLQRQRTDLDVECIDENSAAGHELLELILTFITNSDGSSDDGGDDLEP